MHGTIAFSVLTTEVHISFSELDPVVSGNFKDKPLRLCLLPQHVKAEQVVAKLLPLYAVQEGLQGGRGKHPWVVSMKHSQH